MISNYLNQVTTWSTSCSPSFIDIKVNALVYDNGVFHTNFYHMDYCEKLEKIITGANQLKRRGQFCGKVGGALLHSTPLPPGTSSPAQNDCLALAH